MLIHDYSLIEDKVCEFKTVNELLNAFSLSFKHPNSKMSSDQLEVATIALSTIYSRLAKELSDLLVSAYENAKTGK
jgi:hypothetical protein